MGYSIKNLENAAKNLNRQLEQHSQERGEALAHHVMQRTNQGRGLWFIVLWPAWLLIFVFSGVFFMGVLDKLGIGAPISWIGMVGGVAFARMWYLSEFTVNHPFWSAVFGYIGTFVVVVTLSQYLDISI